MESIIAETENSSSALWDGWRVRQTEGEDMTLVGDFILTQKQPISCKRKSEIFHMNIDRKILYENSHGFCGGITDGK